MKKLIGNLLLFSLLALFLSACGLLQEPAEPSAPIEAAPLEVETGEAEMDTAETAVEPAETVEATAEEEAALAEPTATEEESATGGGELTIYSITPAESQVRFELDEDLRGERITVVGATDQVAGEIGLNLADLSTIQVGEIRINARALSTDNNFRNRAIQNEILDTGSYEFIIFMPTAVNGLPDSAAVGEEVAFTINGDLTIRDVTQPVTFEVTATAVSDNQLTGTATAVVNREAFGLRIPEVRNVANVEEEVELYIDFMANAS